MLVRPLRISSRDIREDAFSSSVPRIGTLLTVSFSSARIVFLLLFFMLPPNYFDLDFI